MFKCKRCQAESRDGAKCVGCQGQFDFPCAGITEGGWRKLGDRKNTWKCGNCKLSTVSSPRPAATASAAPVQADMESIMSELRALSAQMDTLPTLMENIKAIKSELAELKTIRAEYSSLKTGVEFLDQTVDALATKVSGLESEVDCLKKTKDQMAALHDRCSKIEDLHRETEQRSRLNNLEIKGVPVTNSENLFEIIGKIGNIIGCNIPKEQINFIARVPMRNNDQNKNIICSVHSRYLKNDFVAAAKKLKSSLTASKLGLQSDSVIYVNDHLTFENKVLLNKTKILARERGFLYTWVVGCKILIKKNATSPTHHIKTEQDLRKFLS
ncbi:hypothetical protein PYW07_002894 [Mythimna separata]|uniref:FP protein C-terminal domain-containing protein n=1 Tax=Mythimna separata TaxID=271217 RepID=A0AAD8DQB1_MYTSE|nr:hypothetical protein PYW07_002894 [Mythimna separata]